MMPPRARGAGTSDQSPEPPALDAGEDAGTIVTVAPGASSRPVGSGGDASATGAGTGCGVTSGSGSGAGAAVAAGVPRSTLGGSGERGRRLWRAVRSGAISIFETTSAGAAALLPSVRSRRETVDADSWTRAGPPQAARRMGAAATAIQMRIVSSGPMVRHMTALETTLPRAVAPVSRHRPHCRDHVHPRRHPLPDPVHWSRALAGPSR